MGVITTFLSVLCVLLNRPTTPAFVGSVMALAASLGLVALSFAAPWMLHRLEAAGLSAPVSTPRQQTATGAPARR